MSRRQRQHLSLEAALNYKTAHTYARFHHTLQLYYYYKIMADESGLAIVNLSKQNCHNHYINLASKVLPQLLDNQQATLFTLKEMQDCMQKICAGGKGFKYKEAYDGELDNHVHLVPGLRSIDGHQQDGKYNMTHRKVFIIRVADRFNAHVAWLVSKPLILGE